MEKIKFSFQNSSESSGFLLWQVTNLWQREIKKSLDKQGLTHVQFVILASTYWLNSQENECTQVNIANHAKIDIMMTSKVVRTLEEKKLLYRKEHPIDTRAKIVHLSELGIEVLSTAITIVEDFDVIFFNSIHENKEDFNRLLYKIVEQNG